MPKLVIAGAAGLIIGALAWIDPIFIPLVIAGPIITGAVAASRCVGLLPLLVAWIVAGISMVFSDWVVNHEDVAFHLVLTVLMSFLAAGAWALAGRLGNRRGSARSEPAQLG